MIVPVHGETRHLLEHVRFAKECGIAEGHLLENGQVLRLAQDGSEVVDHVPTGRLGLDGKSGDGYRLLSLDGEQLKVRRRMVFNGAAVVTVVMDRMGKVMADPVLSAPGLVDADLDQDVLDDLLDDIRAAIMDLPATVRRDDVVVHETIRVATRRGLSTITGHKPVTEVHLVRV